MFKIHPLHTTGWRPLGEGLVWLTWEVICLQTAPWSQLSVIEGNGWPHNVLQYHSSCQSAVTSETVKCCCWLRDRRRNGFRIRWATLTRKLCYRKDNRAMRPIHGSPDNFRDSLTTPTATIPNIFHGLLFRSTLWMFLQNLKPVALPVPDIIGGTEKFGQSLDTPTLRFLPFLMDFYSDWSYKCTRRIWSPQLYVFLT